MISGENQTFSDMRMRVETPIPPNMITAAAPDGAPPRRIKKVETIICRFSWLGCEPDQFILVSTKQNFFYIFRGLERRDFITF